MPRIFVAIALLALVGCGTPTSESPDTGTSGDAGNNTGQTDTGTANNGGGDMPTSNVDCAALSDQFIDAVRAMPRTCTTAADCKIVPKANVCDCDLAVTAASDTAEYDMIRAQLDAGQCSNPFGCPTGECPYRVLADPGELIPNCSDEGMCEVLQLLPCSEYEARATGGIVPGGACANDGQCSLRTDLNPCGCEEAISANFPALTAQATRDMMDINDARCNVDCTGCPQAVSAACVDNGMEQMVCQTM